VNSKDELTGELQGESLCVQLYIKCSECPCVNDYMYFKPQPFNRQEPFVPRSSTVSRCRYLDENIKKDYRTTGSLELYPRQMGMLFE